MEKTSTRRWDVPSAILLFLLIQVSSWRLQATDWIDSLNLIRTIAIVGLVIGLALGQSIFQKRNVILLSIAYMLVTFLWQWLTYIDFSAEQNELGGQFLILFGRLFTAISELFSGREANDSILLLALLSFPYWIISLYSGYQLTRYSNVMASILSSAITIFIVHYYHYTIKDYSWVFGAYIFLTLLLIGRQKYLDDKTKWAKDRVLYSNESSLDINNTTFTVAAVIVVLAWMIPYSFNASSTAKEAWQNISRDWFSGKVFDNLFSSINQEDKPQAKNFQTELGLGTQTSLSDTVIFLVYAPERAEEYPRLYWRGQIYDTYENGKWYTHSNGEKRYISSRDFEVPDTENRLRLTFMFDVYTEKQFFLFSAAQPISVNHNTIVLHQKISEDLNDLDVSAVRASPPLELGDLVRVTSLMANPIVSELQTASTQYPSWVLNKYLQLPDNFSPEIKSLAESITEGYDNSYDKTVAITNYLRSEIEYSSAISMPKDVDPIAYFLLDLKRGFCNYSATAEVLMLRSIGIPARLAVGYAQGEPNLQNSIYTVRERDLHAWPEVYFPEYGWIEFEPTGNQNPLVRPLEHIEREASVANPIVPRQLPLEEEEPAFVPDEALEEEQVNAVVNQNQIRWIGLFAGFILLAGVGVFVKRRYAPQQSVASLLKRALEKNKIKVPVWVDEFLSRASLPTIERNFQSINSGLRWMNSIQPIHSTPRERATALKKILPSAEEAIDVLLREYQKEMFSPIAGDEKLTKRAAFQISVQAIWVRLKTGIMGYN